MPKGYSDRERLSDEEINKRVDMLDAKDTIFLLRNLVELLYGTDADENWGADTLDELAQLFSNYNLTP
jgi:hypothetical protein